MRKGKGQSGAELGKGRKFVQRRHTGGGPSLGDCGCLRIGASEPPQMQFGGTRQGGGRGKGVTPAQKFAACFFLVACHACRAGSKFAFAKACKATRRWPRASRGGTVDEPRHGRHTCYGSSQPTYPRTLTTLYVLTRTSSRRPLHHPQPWSESAQRLRTLGPALQPACTHTVTNFRPWEAGNNSNKTSGRLPNSASERRLGHAPPAGKHNQRIMQSLPSPPPFPPPEAAAVNLRQTQSC